MKDVHIYIWEHIQGEKPLIGYVNDEENKKYTSIIYGHPYAFFNDEEDKLIANMVGQVLQGTNIMETPNIKIYKFPPLKIYDEHGKIIQATNEIFKNVVNDFLNKQKETV